MSWEALAVRVVTGPAVELVTSFLLVTTSLSWIYRVFHKAILPIILYSTFHGHFLGPFMRKFDNLSHVLAFVNLSFSAFVEKWPQMDKITAKFP